MSQKTELRHLLGSPGLQELKEYLQQEVQEAEEEYARKAKSALFNPAFRDGAVIAYSKMITLLDLLKVLNDIK